MNTAHNTKVIENKNSININFNRRRYYTISIKGPYHIEKEIIPIKLWHRNRFYNNNILSQNFLNENIDHRLNNKINDNNIKKNDMKNPEIAPKNEIKYLNKIREEKIEYADDFK